MNVYCILLNAFFHRLSKSILKLVGDGAAMVFVLCLCIERRAWNENQFYFLAPFFFSSWIQTAILATTKMGFWLGLFKQKRNSEEKKLSFSNTRHINSIDGIKLIVARKKYKNIKINKYDIIM